MDLADAVRLDGDPCCQQGCGAVAVLTVYWPGQTSGMCRPCAVRAVNVAMVMGFVLTIKPREKRDKGRVDG